MPTKYRVSKVHTLKRISDLPPSNHWKRVVNMDLVGELRIVIEVVLKSRHIWIIPSSIDRFSLRGRSHYVDGKNYILGFCSLIWPYSYVVLTYVTRSIFNLFNQCSGLCKIQWFICCGFREVVFSSGRTIPHRSYEPPSSCVQLWKNKSIRRQITLCVFFPWKYMHLSKSPQKQPTLPNLYLLKNIPHVNRKILRGN